MYRTCWSQLPLLWFFLCNVLMSVTTKDADASLDSGAQQSKQYYMADPQNDLHQLHTWGMQKRSLTSNEHDETIYRSLSSLCYQLISSNITTETYQRQGGSPTYDEISNKTLSSLCDQLESGNSTKRTYQISKEFQTYDEIINRSLSSLCHQLISGNNTTKLNPIRGGFLSHDVISNKSLLSLCDLQDYGSNTNTTYKISEKSQNYDWILKHFLSSLCYQFNPANETKITHQRSWGSPPKDERINKSLTALCSHLRSWNNTARTDQRSGGSLNYMERIYIFLTSFCSQFNLDENNDRLQPKPEGVKWEPVFLTNWTGPDIYPVKVEAQKSGDTVYTSFEIVHTGPAFMLRTNLFQATKIPIKYPTWASGAIQSRVNITIDATVCSERGYLKSAVYVLSLENNSNTLVTAKLDICEFNKFRNKNPSEAKWLEQKGIITQDIPIQMFKIIQDNENHELIIDDYKNTLVDIEMHVIEGYRIKTEAYIWDRGLQRLMYSYGEYIFRNPYPPHGKPLKLDILNQALEWEDLLDVMIQMDGTVASIKITVNTADRRRSGQLVLTYGEEPKRNYDMPQVIWSLRMTQSISLKLPFTEEIFPRNMATLVNEKWKFLCNQTGYRDAYYAGQGRNCTISCSAYGTDIKDIRIMKVAGPDSARVATPAAQSMSLIVDKMAVAFVDMGYASVDIDGKYECMVSTQNGTQKRQAFFLYTHNFTRVINTSLEVFRNPDNTPVMTKFTCRVYGVHPLDVGVYLHETNSWRFVERVDNEDNSWKSVSTYYTYLDITFQVSSLLYHWRSISCKASGARGKDSKMTELDSHTYKYSQKAPVIDTAVVRSFVFISPEETFVLCTAIGLPDTEIRIFPAKLPPGMAQEEAEMSRQPGSSICT